MSKLTNSSSVLSLKNVQTAGDNFDYSFNYPEYGDTQVEAIPAHAGPQSAETWIIIVLYAITLLFLLWILLIILVTRPKGNLNVRLFALNLVFMDIIQIVFVLWSEDDKLFRLKSKLGLGFRTFLEKYCLQLEEWSQIIYCTSVTMLIIEAIHRHRTGRSGLHSIIWLFLLMLFDILPLAYMFIKGELYHYVNIMPKPLACYHALALLLATISALVFLVVIVKFGCCRSRSRSPDSTQTEWKMHTIPFCFKSLIRVYFFVLITIIFQYTEVYLISMDITANMVDTSEAMKMMRSYKAILILAFIFVAIVSILGLNPNCSECPQMVEYITTCG
ncbi:hypothetical protein DdX_01891 [Ditylenchus destructor]|uniref:Uncharacterized protein n=1 Tax=Ditylenchus destructor TaxID=166010 RepID=A0AAD4NGL3_9BILA|nr:hypothetical protein DdX_01891 [Ditylenchus destructor]